MPQGGLPEGVPVRAKPCEGEFLPNGDFRTTSGRLIQGPLCRECGALVASGKCLSCGAVQKEKK